MRTEAKVIVTNLTEVGNENKSNESRDNRNGDKFNRDRK